MSDGFKVDLEAMSNAIDKMAAFDTRLDDLLAQVDKHVADLHLSWSGQAAAAQREAHDRWMKEAADMREAVRALKAATAKARGNYHGAVQTNTGMWDL